MLGHHLHASETRLPTRLYLDPSSPHQTNKSYQSWTPLTKLSGSAHGWAGRVQFHGNKVQLSVR